MPYSQYFQNCMILCIKICVLHVKMFNRRNIFLNKICKVLGDNLQNGALHGSRYDYIDYEFVSSTGSCCARRTINLFAELKINIENIFRRPVILSHRNLRFDMEVIYPLNYYIYLSPVGWDNKQSIIATVYTHQCKSARIIELLSSLNVK